jgi:hypothetical protein
MARPLSIGDTRKDAAGSSWRLGEGRGALVRAAVREAAVDGVGGTGVRDGLLGGGRGCDPVCPAVAEGASPAAGSHPHRDSIVKIRDLTPKPTQPRALSRFNAIRCSRENGLSHLGQPARPKELPLPMADHYLSCGRGPPGTPIHAATHSGSASEGRGAPAGEIAVIGVGGTGRRDRRLGGGGGAQPVLPGFEEGTAAAVRSQPHRETIVKMRDLTPKMTLRLPACFAWRIQRGAKSMTRTALLPNIY